MRQTIRIGFLTLALAAPSGAQKAAQVPTGWRELGPAPIGLAFAGQAVALVGWQRRIVASAAVAPATATRVRQVL